MQTDKKAEDPKVELESRKRLKEFQKPPKKEILITKRVAFVLLGSALRALALNLFMRPGGILPGGFAGLSLLIKYIFENSFNINIPYSVLNIGLNLIPGILAFFKLGKKFVLLTMLNIVNQSILVDLIPKYTLTDDVFLNVVFGAIVYGLGSILVLNVNASSGGTDFISLMISKRKGESTWNMVLINNALLYITYGFASNFTSALYSIVFQIIYTFILNVGQFRYQRRTIWIITDKPEELSNDLMNLTQHGVTIFTSIGAYSQQKRYVLYMVVERKDLREIRAFLDHYYPEVFVNVTDSEELIGRFHLDPYD